jgi:N-acetylglucosamine malate deacetylase 1
MSKTPSPKPVKPPPQRKVALAIAAHPDDIEFMMAGTLVLLRHAGFSTHYLNLASGSCGSATLSAARIRAIRRRESRTAATLLGALYHSDLVDDLQIYYERTTLQRLAAVVRKIQPTILLVPSPKDYMEDHTNTCRLAVTAAFVRGMRNFSTSPPQPPVPGDVTVYHAMPHGLRDPLRRRVLPGLFVNTTSVQTIKRSALAAHQSQQQWLKTSQQMSLHLQTMDHFAQELGRISRRFQYAEGWRRHLHYGFCAEQADPLREALGANCQINRRYETDLENGLPPNLPPLAQRRLSHPNP